jgi:hypothetical protein
MTFGLSVSYLSNLNVWVIYLKYDFENYNVLSISFRGNL